MPASLENIKSFLWLLVRILLALLISSITFLIFIKTLDYYQSGNWTGYLWNKKEVFYGIFQFGFWGHIIPTPLLCLIGLLLTFFVKPPRAKKTHQFLGKIYIGGVLFIAAPAGLILSFYALGGFWSILSFSILSSLWWICTLIALLAIKKGDIVRHQRFMNRSFALMSSAIFLRIFGFIASYFFEWKGIDMYITISWLSWIIPLFIVELSFLLKKVNA